MSTRVNNFISSGIQDIRAHQMHLGVLAATASAENVRNIGAKMWKNDSGARTPATAAQLAAEASVVVFNGMRAAGVPPKGTLAKFAVLSDGFAAVKSGERTVELVQELLKEPSKRTEANMLLVGCRAATTLLYGANVLNAINV